MDRGVFWGAFEGLGPRVSKGAPKKKKNEGKGKKKRKKGRKNEKVKST